MRHELKTIEGKLLLSTHKENVIDALRELIQKGIGTRYIDFRTSGFDLSYRTFSEFDLRYCCFEGMNLDSSTFARATINGSNFRKASLQETVFVGTSIAGATFVEADLSGAHFDGVSLSECNMKRSRFRDDVIKGCFAATVRSDGYFFYGLALETGSYKIRAGCRWKTPEEYRQHTEAYYLPDKIRETRLILDYLDKQYERGVRNF